MSAVSETIPTASASAVRRVASHLLGELAVSESQCLRFPAGIPGFDTLREFVLLPSGREGFWWLQAVADDGVTFLLADPFLVEPGYAVDLGQDDVEALGLSSPSDALVLTVVTIPSAPGGVATTNLRGPIVMNVAARVGRQVVSAVEGHGLQVEIALG